MKKWLKIVLLVILLLVANIIFVVSNFNHNISDAEKLNLLDCSDPFSSGFVTSEDCILDSLQNCIPATNCNGLHILGREGDKCKVILGSSEQNLYKCYFNLTNLNSFTEDDLLNLIANLNSNKECNKIGFGSMLFSRIWT